MVTSIGPRRLASLVGEFDRHPAYAGLAASLRLLIGDGRIPHGTRLPSERELTDPLGVSRTTVTRAYAELRERGYVVARQGSGTFTRIPGGPARAPDRVLTPRRKDAAGVDLSCAASAAVPGLMPAVESAVAELPAYLAGHGYYPAGLPELQARIAEHYASRGLPTSPEQVMVTPGALAAAAVVAGALVARGDRVLVESPGYPNSERSFAASGARVVTSRVDEAGWDLDALTAAMRRSRPRVASLVVDFHNPTGHLMSDAERERVAVAAARSGTTLLADECHCLLALDDVPAVRPLAAHAESAGAEAVSVGGASKSFWGGLRVGWLRAPERLMPRLTEARLTLDLGVPLLEQLVLARVLRDPLPLLAAQRQRLREQRDALAAALTEQVPTWTFRPPEGGLTLWCRLPEPLAAELAMQAGARGVHVVPGPVFAAEGGLASYVRIPYTRPVEELRHAVDVLAEAWAVTLMAQEAGGGPRPGPRPMVA